MANIHRTGPVDVNHVDVHVTSSVPTRAIADGDPIALDASGLAYPASAETWNTNEATTRAAFVTKFTGISEGRSRAASTDLRDLRIPVNMDGTYEFDVESATFVVGEFVGPAKAAGNALVNTCKKVTLKTEAVAVVVQNYSTATTRVLARLINTTPKK